MSVRLYTDAFDPFAELRSYQDGLGARARSIGALATFIGTMRDFNEGEPVAAMVLEHYPGMTDKHLERLAADAMDKWQLNDILIVHRVGEVLPGDALVLVAAWSAHRAHAFESCRAVMEDLKSTAPFWKKERTATGARWVETNTPGHSADFKS
jgi:molybdopterin synthase catalytic subunit